MPYFIYSLFLFAFFSVQNVPELRKLGSRGFEYVIVKSFKREVKPDKTFIYKEADGKELKIHSFFPNKASKQTRGCMIFIHGGGWKGGTTQSSQKWCRYTSELGLVSFTVEYRLVNKSRGINPSICLEDVKSAIRWVRQHAADFNVNLDKIILAGTSAGGQLSLACATTSKFNDINDQLGISAKPNLLLLLSPVLDNGPDGYGYDLVKGFWQDFSPAHNLNDSLPPTCMLLGDQDPLIPFESAMKVAKGVKAAGSDIDFLVFENSGHGLFSQKNGELSEPIMLTYFHWHKFLYKAGYVKEPRRLMKDYNIQLHDFHI
ncbi:MAG: alpha/beta hydrolase [Cyclobacteriaceae bacterium]